MSLLLEHYYRSLRRQQKTAEEVLKTVEKKKLFLSLKGFLFLQASSQSHQSGIGAAAFSSFSPASIPPNALNMMGMNGMTSSSASSAAVGRDFHFLRGDGKSNSSTSLSSSIFDQAAVGAGNCSSSSSHNTNSSNPRTTTTSFISSDGKTLYDHLVSASVRPFVQVHL